MDGRLKSDTICFEGFRLERGILYGLDDLNRSEPVLLGSRALGLLELLAKRSGEVVSKDEILQAVWPGIAVEESNLTVQISKLARVLDKARKQSSIQPLPGRG